MSNKNSMNDKCENNMSRFNENGIQSKMNVNNINQPNEDKSNFNIKYSNVNEIHENICHQVNVNIYNI